MDLKSLQMFQHLAKTLHFGKTADAFYVSPSTLSRSLQRLEQSLNCQLFERDNRSVRITAAGKVLLEYSEQQLSAWHQLKQQLSDQQTELSGKLHLYCSVTAAYTHLPQLVDRFRQQYPQVELVISTGDAAEAVQQVSSEQADIAIAAQPEVLAKNLYFVAIAEIPLWLIAPAFNCPVQQQLQPAKIDWSQMPFILAEHGAVRKRFDTWYKTKSKTKAKIYATVSGHEALVSMVALGCGVALAPQVVVEASPVKDRIQYLRDAGTFLPFTLGVCCTQKAKQSPLVAAFLTSTQTI